MIKLPKKAFTLIELMIVVVVVSVLASIAIPYYEGYTSKAKIVDMITSIDSCQTQIYSSVLQNGTFPTSITCAGNTFNSSPSCTTPVPVPSTVTTNAIKSQGSTPYIYANYCINSSNNYAGFILINTNLTNSSSTPYDLHIRYTIQANGELQTSCGYIINDINKVPVQYLPTNCQINFSN